MFVNKARDFMKLSPNHCKIWSYKQGGVRFIQTAILALFCLGYLFPMHLFGNMAENLGYPWGGDRHSTLVKLAKNEAKRLKHYQDYTFPIETIVLFNHLNSQKVRIFSYGSLLNQTSARRTLSPESMKTYRPAIAFGLKRVFNRSVPETTRWGPLDSEKDIGMLNVAKVRDFGKITNGVIFEVDQIDLLKLVSREVGYDLIPVVVMLWEDAFNHQKLKPSVFVAYTFFASAEKRKGKVYTDGCVNPVPGYYFASKKGAARYGKAFLSVWMNSTFLADAKTPVNAWEEFPILRVCPKLKKIN